MLGAIRLLSQYAFMAWCLVKKTGDTSGLDSCRMIQISVLKMKLEFKSNNNRGIKRWGE
jgi:hypothetical protein